MPLKYVLFLRLVSNPRDKQATLHHGRSSDFIVRYKRLPENISDIGACTVIRTTYSCGTVGDSHPHVG